MNRAALTNICFLIAGLFFACSTPATQGQNPVKLYGKVDELATACANAGINVSGNKFPLRIEKVRLGSPAYYAGVRENDKVLSGSIDKTRMNLKIERNGKTYAMGLSVQAHSYPTQPLKPATDAVPVSLAAKEDRKEIELFKNYDVAFVIDRSGSMGEPLQTLPQTKWQWCQSQINSFTQEAGTALPNGFNIFMFNDTYIALKNCSANDIQRCFQDYTPVGNTDLGDPLEEAFNLPHTSKKLLIVVLTDGLPNRGPDAEEIVIRNSQRLSSSDDVLVTFLEIGEEYPGQGFLTNMDNGLVAAGAKYDIVRTLTFDQVKAAGLTKALISVIKNRTTGTP